LVGWLSRTGGKCYYSLVKTGWRADLVALPDGEVEEKEVLFTLNKA
jgi:hypothetical protein